MFKLFLFLFSSVFLLAQGNFICVPYSKQFSKEHVYLYKKSAPVYLYTVSDKFISKVSRYKNTVISNQVFEITEQSNGVFVYENEFILGGFPLLHDKYFKITEITNLNNKKIIEVLYCRVK
jgi:hypothetical protein